MDVAAIFSGLMMILTGVVATFLVIGGMLRANARVMAAMAKALDALAKKVRCDESNVKE